MTVDNKRMRQARAGSFLPCLVVTVLFSLSLNVFAANTPLRADTQSFTVDIGLVAARELRKRPQFIDRDKEFQFHSEALYAPDMHHLTVALSDRKTGKNVRDATVIATVRHKKWRHGEKAERPLERMAIDDTISYGNFFRMAEPGTYEISLKIYRPQSNGPEEAKFSYDKPEE